MAIETLKVENRAVTNAGFLGNELIDRWISFAGVSEKTAKAYRGALKQLAKYFAAEGITRPARADVEAWRDSLIAAKKSPSTVQLYLTSVKIFFRFLAQEGIYPNITDNLKSKVKINHAHKKDALTATQAGNLLRSVQGDSLKAKRDRAILALMMTAGLRTIEVSRLDIADMIDEFGKTYLLIQGKGHASKDAKVLLPVQVKKLVDEYLAARHADDDEPLFTSTARRNRGERLSTQVISKMAKAHLRAIGLDSKRLTAHSLRHTAATTMILSGVSLTDVQQVLRHVNVNTTMIYNNAVERMRNAAEQTACDTIFATLPAQS